MVKCSAMRKILLILALFVGLSGNVAAQNSRYYPVIMMMGQSSCDADALAFISATGITDVTQKAAICQLVLDLKFYSLWTKMQAIYPMVGGTATTHKYNLKDPQDTDAAFRIVWSGGITHSSTGAQGNGTTGYGDTKYNPFTSGNQDSQHLSYYSRTNVSEASAEMGVYSGAIFCQLNISTSGTSYFGPNVTAVGLMTYSNPNTTGYYVANRVGVTDQNAWKNGVEIATSSYVSGTLPADNVFILTRKSGGPGPFSTRECAFATIGTGLTDTDQANLYTIVQAFQTTLGRQI